MRQVRRSPLEETLRRLLTARREAAGITQAQLAGAMQRPQSYVSKVERGERRLEVAEFMDYARALGDSPDVLMRELQDQAERRLERPAGEE